MAFYGCSFCFNGKSSEEFGVMLYDVGSASESDGNFAVPSAQEERIPRKIKTNYYGKSFEDVLEFELTFGPNMDEIDSGEPFDRFEMERISQWLIGVDGYKWLSINQPDMDTFRYNCRISELTYMTVGKYPWAFNCKITCDSPFAYTYEQTAEYTVSGTLNINYYNRSTCGSYYYPDLEIIPTVNGASTISIKNDTDNGKIFKLEKYPCNTSDTISVSGDNCIIESTSVSNPYQYFNFNFLRMVDGYNSLILSGNFTVKFICSYPVSIGG